MGYEIHRWLMDQLPADCSILERAVAAQIAIRADDTTRETWPPLEDLARWTGAATEASVRDALKRLSARGWELRVVIGARAKDGRKVFAVQGKKLTFRVPTEQGPVEPTRESPLSTKESPLSTRESGLSSKESGTSTRESPLAPETKRPKETKRDLVETSSEADASADDTEPWVFTPEPGAIPTGPVRVASSVPVLVKNSTGGEELPPPGPTPPRPRNVHDILANFGKPVDRAYSPAARSSKPDRSKHAYREGEDPGVCDTCRLPPSNRERHLKAA